MMVLTPRPGSEPGSGESSGGRLIGAAPRNIPIQGSLEDWPLAELVQFLNRTRQTGELALERGDPAQVASISMRQGLVVHAICPPLAGNEAVLALLNWQHGRFLFLAGPVAATRTVQAELRTLLLEGARRGDELNRLLVQLPPAETVLYPVHEAASSGVFLSRLAWNLLSHIDGVATVIDLVESRASAQIELAEALIELIRAGLITTTPDTTFLAEISVRRLVEPTGAGDVIDAMLKCAENPITLAKLVADLGCGEEAVLRYATALVDGQWLEVCAGHEAYLRHLHHAICPRL